VCRLFALHAGPSDVTAQFWLLDAPDSLAAQSETNADGFGLGALTAEDGLLLIRNPVQASSTRIYERVAHEARACQFLAHLRYADTGSTALRNTHPFAQGPRLFAHNGVVGDLERLEERLGNYMAMVAGDTDSERFFGLITKSIYEAGGDTEAGITAAVRELAEGYELYSLNFLIVTRGHLWAFRYPEHNSLFILDRSAGGPSGCEPLHEESPEGNLEMHLEEGSDRALVVIASERMDGDPGWDEIGVGELVHIDPELSVVRKTIVDGPPAKPMVLHGRATKSQTA
jgi:predicted glutamine amidotransferase